MTVLLSLLAGSLATVVAGFLVGAWIAGYRPNLRMRMVRRDGEWVAAIEDRCRDLSCTCNLDRTS